jgi:hypothetical protein
MRPNLRHFETSTIAVAVFLVALLVAAQLAAAPSAWPKKKGELCWVATSPGPEYSLVRAQITNMGSDHYLFHGQAYRVASPGDLTSIGMLQALGGNVEFDEDGDRWIGQITKTEVLLRNPPIDPNLLEAYVGLLILDSVTLDGTVEGVITTCEAGYPNSVCGSFNTGPIAMTLTACP